MTLYIQKYVGGGAVEFVPSDTEGIPRIFFLVGHASLSNLKVHAYAKVIIKNLQFTDILLITSLTTIEKYRIHHKFSLKNLLVHLTTAQCTMTIDV